MGGHIACYVTGRRRLKGTMLIKLTTSLPTQGSPVFLGPLAAGDEFVSWARDVTTSALLVILSPDAGASSPLRHPAFDLGLGSHEWRIMRVSVLQSHRCSLKSLSFFEFKCLGCMRKPCIWMRESRRRWEVGTPTRIRMNSRTSGSSWHLFIPGRISNVTC